MAQTAFPLRALQWHFRTLGRWPLWGGWTALHLFQWPLGARAQPTKSKRMQQAQTLFAQATRKDLRVGVCRVRTYRFEPAAPSAQAPQLLLVHGFTSRALHLSAYVDAATKAGWRVWCLDLPGHGESSGRFCPAPDAARSIRAVAHLAGPLDAAIGHSFGGAMLSLAQDPSFEPEHGFPLPQVVLLGATDALEDVTLRFARALHISEATRRAFEQRLGRQNGRPVSSFAIRDIWRQQPGRLLVVHDQDDAEVPFSDGKQVAEASSRAELMATRGFGHRKILYKTAVVKRVMDFLSPEAKPAEKMPRLDQNGFAQQNS